MHYRLDDLPQGAEFEGMAVSHTRIPRGADLGQVLEGLPNDLCPCPHWGYVFAGRMIVKYADGSVEEIGAGDVYYTPPGHTAVVEEDSVSVDFSPIEPWRQLMEHMASRGAATLGDAARTG